MNAATISPSTISENLQFCKMTAIFPHEMTKSSALLASRHSFLQEVIKQNDDFYGCHGLVPHPEREDGG